MHTTVPDQVPKDKILVSSDGNVSAASPDEVRGQRRAALRATQSFQDQHRAGVVENHVKAEGNSEK